MHATSFGRFRKQSVLLVLAVEKPKCTASLVTDYELQKILKQAASLREAGLDACIKDLSSKSSLMLKRVTESRTETQHVVLQIGSQVV